MAVLIGMSTEVRGQQIPVVQGDLAIGRSPSNAIVLDNATVSSKHCVIHRDGNRFTLKDLGSTNGTRVNSKEVTEMHLKPKDIVQVGSVEFIFDAEEVDLPQVSTLAETQVEEEQGPTAAPESFSSISPFGARKQSSKGIWFFLITIIGILTVLFVFLYFWRLVTTE